MEIKLATKQDVPKLLELRQKAFGALFDELGINPDSLAENASLDDAYEEFDECTTLKAINDKGCIVGSVQGNVAYGLLFIGRLMVLPECQNNGIGRRLFREIQSCLPHRHAWLCTCQQVRPPFECYLREGFKPYKSEIVGPSLTWVYMEKAYSYLTLRDKPELKDEAAESVKNVRT